MLAEKWFKKFDDWYYKRKYGVDYERVRIEPKQIVVLRYPKQEDITTATQTANNLARLVNENPEMFQSPVLILQEGMDLESVSIEELETILEHAKDISDKKHQEKNQFEQNLDLSGLEDLIPKQVK